MMRWIGKIPLRGTSRAVALLTLGRTIGFAVAFAIPIVLVRSLTQTAFGIYKYLFLLYSTLGFMQIGMAESLYFFVPRSRDEAPRAVVNALVTLAGAGAVSALVLGGFARTVARWSGNGTIAVYLPALGVFLALMLVSLPLEIVMVSRKQCGVAGTTYAASDALRALALCIPGVLTHDLRLLLAGVIVFAIARCVALGLYLWREFGRSLRIDVAVWKAQLAYALPFAAAVVIETIQMNLHQYVVWAKFDAASFAIYSVGCLQIPLVDLLATSTTNVMMVRMGEDGTSGSERVRMWKEAVERLAFVFVPLVAALLLTAHDAIVTLFTARYTASTPIFRVSVVMIVLASFPVDSVLRVYAATRFLMLMNILRLTIIAAGIVWCIQAFGLTGAILITVAGTCASKAFAVWWIRRLFSVSWAEVLPWRRLAIIAALATLSLGPAAWLHGHLAGLPALARGAATASFYALTYLGAAACVRLAASRRASAARIASALDDSKSLV